MGLTTAACLASLGHRLKCADQDPALVGRLRRGMVDIMGPGLAGLVEGLAVGRLRFDAAIRNAVACAEAVFLCLPTPAGLEGHPT